MFFVAWICVGVGKAYAVGYVYVLSIFKQLRLAALLEEFV